jgi:sugar transferase (PEP-CTERM/EpsH1 system associated)
MKILFIAEAFPYPPVTGDRIRVFNIIKYLAKFHDIYLTAFLANPGEEKYVPEMRKYCREVHTVTARRFSKWRHLPGVAKALITGEPLDAKFVFCRPMQLIIQDILKRNPVDLIHIEHAFMASYLNAVPKLYPAKKVLAFQNICHVQYKRFFQTERKFFKKVRNLLNWLAMETWEPRMAGRFDQCIAVSEADKSMLLKKNPRLNIAVAPNGVDVQQFQSLGRSREKGLIFTGKMSYPPNSEAALYFAQEIFPLIKAEIPGAKLYIIGGQPPESLRALSNARDIEVTGFVEDLIPYYAKSQVAIVPLRAGSGTRLKILEAMALGRPVVATSLGCEGIEAEHGKNIFIADDAPAFARCCVQLMTEPAIWARLAENGRKLAEEKYSWEKIGDRLNLGYLALVAASERRSGK